MKKFLTSVMAAAVVLLTAGCSNSFESGDGGRYGSLVIPQPDGARALDYSLLTSATVSVSGTGMETISKTVSVSNGAGEIVINKIPVGKNRVVMVASNVDGAVISEVIDITPNCNEVCNVTWATTARANIFKALIDSNKDVSSIEQTYFDSYIPDVHSSLVNSSKIASDYISGSFGTADSYILDYGTVTVNTSGLSGWKVQITDIATEKVTVLGANQSFTLKATPGTWKVWVFDENNNLKADYVKTIAVAEKLTSTVDIVHIEGGTPVTGKIIVHVPSSLNYNYIWAWNPTSTSTNYTGGVWPGKEMTENGSYYDYTLDGKTAAGIIFNKNQNGSTAGNGQTADLYITEGEWNYIGGASGTLDTTGASISYNFEKATVEESLSVNVINPAIPMPPTVTCDYTDGEEISTTGTVTFTVTSENTALTSGTYTVGSNTGTLSLGTNRVDLPSGLSAGQTISLSATVTNEKGTAVLGPITLNLIEATPSTPTRLGAFYERCATSFSIWSPTYSNVKVAVKKQGESDFTTYTCTKGFTVDGGYSDTSNIYGVTVMGDCNLAEYQFYINGKAVRDPYGKMVKYVENKVSVCGGKTIPQSENIICNNTNFYTGGPIGSSWAGPSVNIVVDAENILPSDGAWATRPVMDSRCDAVVYEVHVQDFTSSSTWNGSEANRGKFSGMVESGTTYTKGTTTVKTGFDHLKELGVTHVQIMPMYDFATKYVNSTGQYYNWGYDPVNYNVPEDRYSTCPGDYVERIREVKDMVNEFHKNGIRVVMDVVYNHTFSGEMFENITGKYYTTNDLSGCGNSVDVSNAMVSRMVRDSLEYWAEVYNLDGFRFDLMAIYTKSALEDWGTYLNNTNPETKDRKLLMQGEPWQANNNSSSDYGYASAIPSLSSAHIGCFAGKWRETLKGASDDGNTLGYIFSGRQDKDGAATLGNTMVGIRGSGTSLGSDSEGVWTRYFTANPEQAVNYLMAHDNLCFYDKIKAATSANTDSNYTSYADAIVKFGHGILLSSQGIPFIHCGDEFLRTKAVGTFAGEAHNSYMWGIEMNQINWSYKATNYGCFKYHKDMIAFRKANDGLRYRNGLGNISNSGNVIYYTVKNTSSSPSNKNKSITIVINPNSDFDYTGSGTMVMNKTGAVNSTTDKNCEGTGVTIFAQ